MYKWILDKKRKSCTTFFLMCRLTKELCFLFSLPYFTWNEKVELKTKQSRQKKKKKTQEDKRAQLNLRERKRQSQRKSYTLRFHCNAPLKMKRLEKHNNIKLQKDNKIAI